MWKKRADPLTCFFDDNTGVCSHLSKQVSKSSRLLHSFWLDSGLLWLYGSSDIDWGGNQLNCLMRIFWEFHFLFAPTIKSRTSALAATLVGTTVIYYCVSRGDIIACMPGKIVAVETLLFRNTRTQRIISLPLPSVPLPPWFHWNIEHLFKIPEKKDIQRLCSFFWEHTLIWFLCSNDLPLKENVLPQAEGSLSIFS